MCGSRGGISAADASSETVLFTDYFSAIGSLCHETVTASIGFVNHSALDAAGG
jgi:hypothetical protein